MLNKCKKRNGEVVEFDPSKIKKALWKCFYAVTDEGTAPGTEEVIDKIHKAVLNSLAGSRQTEPDVETIQRFVIQQLWAEGLFAHAEHYQNYREERRLSRLRAPIDPSVQARFDEMKEHFPTDLQVYQFMSKFSRWKEEQKRRETWSETVFQRVTPWLFKLPGVTLTDQEKDMLQDGMYNLESSPAMRVVQMAGPALDRCNVGAYNCLAKETRFITNQGVKSFEDFSDGDVIEVLTHTGSWRKAVVRCYGKQKLNCVRLVRGRSVYDVFATSNHRWILKHGSVTSDLKEGDQIHAPPETFLHWDFDKATEEEKQYWVKGFVYGDGTVLHNRKNTSYKSWVRLCGKKASNLSRFTSLGHGYTQPPSYNGDPLVTVKEYTKELPSLEKDGIDAVRAFVRGYLDADGSKNDPNVSSNLFASIQTTGDQSIEFIQKVFPSVGVYISRQEDIPVDTGYGRTGRTIRFGLVETFGTSHQNGNFTVKSIEKTDRYEDVWCLEVEGDRSFVLESGVVTGNCAYHPLKDLFSFAELLYILMQGTGAGFSVEDEYVSQLPRVKKQTGKVEKLICGDSTEEWCDTFLRHLELLWDGYDTDVDVSRVRKKNTRLKTKGGRASGPEPFLELIAFSRVLIKSRQGRFLEDIDVHDLACKIGTIVQVGGVRRAAEISLSDLNSRAMREAKSGNWYEGHRHRTMANNSAVYDFDEGVPVEVFMEEWLSLVKSKSGERGIFNRRAARLNRPQRRVDWQFGCNPCFTGDTLVWTIYGPKRFDELVGSEVPVLSQDSNNRLVYKRMFNITRTRKNADVYRVRVQSNRRGVRYGEFKATADHVVFLHDGTERKVGELKKGDRLSSVYRAKANSKGYLQLRNTAGDKEMEHKVVVSWKHGSRPEYPEFHVDHIDQNKTNNLPDNLRVMTGKEHDALKMMGDQNPMRRFPERNLGKFKPGCKTKGFTGRKHTDETREKMSSTRQLMGYDKRYNHIVESVEYIGQEDVYDGTVDDTHRFFIYTEEDGGVLVHNCAEIILRPFQFCNLSIAVARPNDTRDSLVRKVRQAAYFGKIQSMATRFGYIRPDWQANCVEERLLGVDITGHADCPLLRFGAPDRHLLIRDLAKVVTEVDHLLSARWGVRLSAANTTIKPGGDSAVFFNSASGVSPWFADYGIRWVREPHDTPVARFLRDSGVPTAPAPERPGELAVFGFPRQAPEGATTRNNMTALQQLENWLEWKENWAEHSVSATIYVEDHEWPEVGAWVYKRIDKITGLSFLPKDNGIYTYAPNEEVTAEKFKELQSAFPDLNWAKLTQYEEEDETTSRQTIACTGQGCD